MDPEYRRHGRVIRECRDLGNAKSLGVLPRTGFQIRDECDRDIVHHQRNERFTGGEFQLDQRRNNRPDPTEHKRGKSHQRQQERRL